VISPQFGTARSGKEPKVTGGFGKVPNGRIRRETDRTLSGFIGEFQHPLNEAGVTAPGPFDSVMSVKGHKEFFPIRRIDTVQ
jgi:hypothetical protein